MPNTKTAMLLLAGACTLMPQWAAASLVTFDFNGVLSDPGSGVTASKSISSYSQNDPILGSLTLDFNPAVLAVRYGDNVTTGPTQIIFFDQGTDISFLAGFKNPIQLDICATASYSIEAYRNGSKIGEKAEGPATGSTGFCTDAASWNIGLGVDFGIGNQVPDTLKFVAQTGATFYLDNLQFNVEAPSVPEPASVGLVALALGTAGLATRRRRS